MTRAAHQSLDLVGRLEALGARVHAVPVIDIVPPLDQAPLMDALARLAEYDWLLFTSANAVSVVLDRGTVAGVKVACVGEATAEALRSRGITADLVPERFVAEGLLDALRARLGTGIKGTRFLLPRAARAREILPESLRRLGATVDVVDAYRTVPCEGARDRLRSCLSQVEIVTFTSSSTVRFLDALLDDETRIMAQSAACVCVGPVTAETAIELDYRVAAVAERSTVEGLVEAVVSVKIKE